MFCIIQKQPAPVAAEQEKKAEEDVSEEVDSELDEELKKRVAEAKDPIVREFSIPKSQVEAPTIPVVQKTTAEADGDDGDGECLCLQYNVT